MISDVEHRATVRQSQGLHPVRDYPGWAHLLNARLWSSTSSAARRRSGK